MCGLLPACQSVLVHETRSPYSHIQVRDIGAQRALLFLDDAGNATVETLMDLREPHRLQHQYSHTLMAGLLYAPNPSEALLVGLGGGAVVRFLEHELPALRLDVVDIDPVVVDIARDYFGTRAGSRTRIFARDAYEYMQHAEARYDIVFLDAHLKPGEGNDASGQPLRLKSAAFLRNLKARLRPGGVAVFNLMAGPHTAADIVALRGAVEHAVIFYSAWQGNQIVVALPAGPLPAEAELLRRARALDARGGRGFTFESLLGQRGG